MVQCGSTFRLGELRRADVSSSRLSGARLTWEKQSTESAHEYTHCTRARLARRSDVRTGADAVSQREGGEGLPRRASRSSAPLPDCYSAHSQPTGAVSTFSPSAAAVSSSNNGSAQSANPPNWERRRSAHLSTRYSTQSTHCEADRVLINARSLCGCYMLNDRGTQHNSWKPIVQILNWALYFL